MAGQARCGHCGAHNRVGMPLGLPTPRAVGGFDHARKHTNICITVIGDDPVRALREVATRAPDVTSLHSIQWPGASSAAPVYASVRMGDIRGYRTYVHLFAVPVEQEPWAEAFFEGHVAASDAVLLTSWSPRVYGWPEELHRWLAAGLAAARVPRVALLGGDWLRPAWTERSATPTLYCGQDAIAAVKVIAKDVLTWLAKGK